MSAANKHTLVLDVMGADSGPETIIGGGVDAARKLGDCIHLVFVGNEEKIRPVLDSLDSSPDNISFRHARTEVPMRMVATNGVRMRDSSIAVGLQMVKNGEAAAFLSPGNTGAVMASALLTLGRIEGVSRPAIASIFPTSKGTPCVVLDVGANADCKPQHLAQFAVMGSVYSSIACRVHSPRVGLVSIGEERSKGKELIFMARERLKDSKINFVGNIEGRDILTGDVDVAVVDGFTGNVLLKFAESVQPVMVNAVNRQIRSNVFSRFGVMLLLPFLKRMRSTFDYAESGGAPLLGVDGIVVIAHGSSNVKAISSAVTLAHEMANKRIKQRIHDELITNHFGKNNDAKDKSQNNRDGIVYSATGNDEC